MKRGLCCLLIILLTGCGFHLRGTGQGPTWLSQVGIVLQKGHRDLVPFLKDQLQGFNISVAPSPGQALYLLIIENDSIQRQITSVSASTTPRQYELLYAVTFTLISTKGNILVPSTTVSVNRQLTVNNDRILGSTYEESTLLREMQRDAVMQIINRLSRK